MLVSIVVNNYNYARYLRAAIDSALAQTWPELEVVVVDDGSTDGSWPLIESYGSRIRALRQPNGGQGAAYNSGFAASGGEWLLFLDADDVLDADAVARLMVCADPEVAKVQGALRQIDIDGEPLRGVVPYLLHDGDVRPIARHFRAYASPPGSGNLLRRSAIAPYFPLHAPSWRRSADTVPLVLAAFHGTVVTVPGTIGCYRLHASGTRSNGLFGNISRSFAEALLQADKRRGLIEDWGTRCTGIAWPAACMAPPHDWRLRALSWRLHTAQHPYPEDTRRRIWQGMQRSLACWPGYTAAERAGLRMWQLVMLCAPRRWVAALASSNASAAWRSRFKLLRAGAQRPA